MLLADCICAIAVTVAAMTTAFVMLLSSGCFALLDHKEFSRQQSFAGGATDWHDIECPTVLQCAAWAASVSSISGCCCQRAYVTKAAGLSNYASVFVALV